MAKQWSMENALFVRSCVDLFCSFFSNRLQEVSNTLINHLTISNKMVTNVFFHSVSFLLCIRSVCFQLYRYKTIEVAFLSGIGQKLVISVSFAITLPFFACIFMSHVWGCLPKRQINIDNNGNGRSTMHQHQPMLFVRGMFSNKMHCASHKYQGIILNVSKYLYKIRVKLTHTLELI